MKVTEDMIAKIRNGDSISDAELSAMIKFFEKLVIMLDVMGPAYGLPLRASTTGCAVPIEDSGWFSTSQK